MYTLFTIYVTSVNFTISSDLQNILNNFVEWRHEFADPWILVLQILNIFLAPISFKEISSTFTPQKRVPDFKKAEILCDEHCNEIDVFSSLFPKNLYMWISECTNERLKALEVKTKKEYLKTDYKEIMLLH